MLRFRDPRFLQGKWSFVRLVGVCSIAGACTAGVVCYEMFGSASVEVERPLTELIMFGVIILGALLYAVEACAAIKLPKIAIILIICFLIIAAPMLRKQERPTLTETLAWIDETYNRHPKGPYFEGGHGRFKDVHGPIARMTLTEETFSAKGCVVTLTSEDVPISQTDQGEVSRTIDTLNLRDIDPNTIKIQRFDSIARERCKDDEYNNAHGLNCDEAEIGFSAHNEASTIDETFLSMGKSKKWETTIIKRNNSFLDVDDVEYAGHLANALEHAVELCGGKRSTF